MFTWGLIGWGSHVQIVLCTGSSQKERYSLERLLDTSLSAKQNSIELPQTGMKNEVEVVLENTILHKFCTKTNEVNTPINSCANNKPI